MSNRVQHRNFGLIACAVLVLATGCASGASTAAPSSPVTTSSATSESAMRSEMSSAEMSSGATTSAATTSAATTSDSAMPSGVMISDSAIASEAMAPHPAPTSGRATSSASVSDPGSASPSTAGSSGPAAGSTSAVAPVPLAAWQQVQLTDTAGAAFTVGELAGTPVFVEFFATWCPTCRAQLARTNEAAGQLAGKAVVLALSTETDLNAADLAKYQQDNNFSHVRFAVMTPDMLAAVVQAFGNDAANPPSTPHLVVSGAGAVGELRTGSEDPASIVGSLQR